MTTRSCLGPAGSPPSVSSSQADSDRANSQPSEVTTDDLEVFEPEQRSEERFLEPTEMMEDLRTMRLTEATERRGSKRKSESTPAVKRTGKKKARANPKLPPKQDVKTGDVIIHDGKISDVGKRVGTVRGKYINTFNVYPRHGEEPYSVDLGRVEYQKVGDGEHVLFTAEDEEAECLMEMVPYHLHGNQECMQAKREELDKIVNKYKAVEEVDDDGQVRISCKFVMWYKKSSDGTVKTRSRLVARGFEETVKVDSDSPVMDASSIKIIMAYARAKGMRVISADVRSAFLQGLPLTERTVYVQPPREAEVEKGKIWKLRVSLYGLQDASLRFHWKVRTVFKEMGLEQSKLDPAVFYMRDSKGEVAGIIGSHVDDFMIAGTPEWTDKMVEDIGSKFELGSVEKDNFMYCGHRVIQDEAGNIKLSQDEYAKEVKDLYISPQRKRQSQEPVTETERKQLRAYAGKLGWLSRLSRPDLAFAQIEASSAVTTATVADLKLLQKAVMRVKEEKCEVMVPKLPNDVKEWKLTTFTDAAWQNLRGVGSTGGRALFLSGGEHSFAVHWAAHRLRRVCHSSQAAEIMSMNEGLSDAAYVRTMIHELSRVWLEAELVTDCKNAFQALTRTTAPTDKRVKCEAQAVREALLVKEVKKIKLVKGESQLADVLTKRKMFPSDFLHLVQTGDKLDRLGY